MFEYNLDRYRGETMVHTCKDCTRKLGKPNHLRCGNKKSHMFEKPVTNNFSCGLIRLC